MCVCLHSAHVILVGKSLTLMLVWYTESPLETFLFLKKVFACCRGVRHAKDCIHWSILISYLVEPSMNCPFQWSADTSTKKKNLTSQACSDFTDSRSFATTRPHKKQNKTKWNMRPLLLVELEPFRLLAAPISLIPRPSIIRSSARKGEN